MAIKQMVAVLATCKAFSPSGLGTTCAVDVGIKTHLTVWAPARLYWWL